MHHDKPWSHCLYRFYSDDGDGHGRHHYRNNTIKLFPHIVQANWALQMAIGKYNDDSDCGCGKTKFADCNDGMIAMISVMMVIATMMMIFIQFNYIKR